MRALTRAAVTAARRSAVVSCAHRALTFTPSSAVSAGACGRRAMAGAAAAPVAAMLTARLAAAFAPTHMELVNESGKHAVPAGSESHFKLFIVSDAFAGLAPLARHRAVNAAVAAGGEHPVHALSISAKTPTEWSGGAKLQSTPSCLGGGAADRAAAASGGAGDGGSGAGGGAR